MEASLARIWLGGYVILYLHELLLTRGSTVGLQGTFRVLGCF